MPCPCDAGVMCVNAVLGGHLEMFCWVWRKYAEENYLKAICSIFAHHGHTKMLKWLSAGDEGTYPGPELCPNRTQRLVDMAVCKATAKYSHMDVLQWAMERGCDYDLGLCHPVPWREQIATEEEFTESLKQWLHQ